VLQCVAVCCSVLQRVAACCSAALCCSMSGRNPCTDALQCVAVRCSALQCVAVRCSAQHLLQLIANTLQLPCSPRLIRTHRCTLGTFLEEILKSQLDTEFVVSNDYRAGF